MLSTSVGSENNFLKFLKPFDELPPAGEQKLYNLCFTVNDKCLKQILSETYKTWYLTEPVIHHCFVFMFAH